VNVAKVEDAGREDGNLLAPSSTASAKCSSFPAPPLATRGTGTDWLMCRFDLVVVAVFHSVGVDTVEDDFAGTEFHCSDGPGASFPFGGFASAVREDGPIVRCGAFGVDGDDDALAAEFVGSGADEIGSGEGGGVQADFVRSGAEHGANVFDGAQPTPTVRGMKH